MSKDWAADINAMHQKFGVHEWFEANKDNQELMRKYLRFRLKMVNEEMNETLDAALFDRDSEEIVDGLIDMIVFAIGTLDVFGVDPHEAWDKVFDANMQKRVGVKPGRPNPFGLPDLLKPVGWKSPTHEGNHGSFPDAL